MTKELKPSDLLIDSDMIKEEKDCDDLLNGSSEIVDDHSLDIDQLTTNRICDREKPPKKRDKSSLLVLEKNERKLTPEKRVKSPAAVNNCNSAGDNNADGGKNTCAGRGTPPR